MIDDIDQPEYINNIEPENKMDSFSDDKKTEELHLLSDNQETRKNIDKEKETRFLQGIVNKIKSMFGQDFKEKGFPKFKEGLEDMLSVGIIRPEEKDQILEEVRDPEVREAIKTRIIGQTVSIGYMPLNMGFLTPTAGIMFGAGAGAATMLTFYILKRAIVGITIRLAGKNISNINHISKMALRPIIGAHMPLIDLAKKYPLTAEHYFAFRKTSKERKKFNNETDEKIKKQRGIKRKENVEQQKEWFEKSTKEKIKDALMTIPKKIKEGLETTGRSAPAWQLSKTENTEDEKDTTKQAE